MNIMFNWSLRECSCKYGKYRETLWKLEAVNSTEKTWKIMGLMITSIAIHRNDNRNIEKSKNFFWSATFEKDEKDKKQDKKWRNKESDVRGVWNSLAYYISETIHTGHHSTLFHHLVSKTVARWINFFVFRCREPIAAILGISGNAVFYEK